VEQDDHQADDGDAHRSSPHGDVDGHHGQDAGEELCRQEGKQRLARSLNERGAIQVAEVPSDSDEVQRNRHHEGDENDQVIRGVI
jgi:hypothetical protein